METRHPVEELHRCGGGLEHPVDIVEMSPRVADVRRVVRTGGVLVTGHHEFRSERLHLVERASPRVTASARGFDEREVHAVVDHVAGDGQLQARHPEHGCVVTLAVTDLHRVPPWRDGGQAQYIEYPVPETTDSGTAAARQWTLENLHEPATLADLAGHSHMSLRTFARRFAEEVGMSPGRWLIKQRVDRARHLLDTTDLPVDEIAG